MEARLFLLLTTKGKMSVSEISKNLGISESEALRLSKCLIKRGAFIDLSETEFEVMHPRFTTVNMYRRMCEANGLKFQRNDIVDKIGALLEDAYYSARTK